MKSYSDIFGIKGSLELSIIISFVNVYLFSFLWSTIVILYPIDYNQVINNYSECYFNDYNLQCKNVLNYDI